MAFPPPLRCCVSGDHRSLLGGKLLGPCLATFDAAATLRFIHSGIGAVGVPRGHVHNELGKLVCVAGALGSTHALNMACGRSACQYAVAQIFSK